VGSGRVDTSREILTYERAHELFDYKDGTLHRKTSGRGYRSIVGCTSTDGYVSIRVDYIKYKAHRIIFMMHHGYFPENPIDHINHKRDDNRIENLREVSISCNAKNSSTPVRAKSGVRGVSLCSGRWEARARKDGIYLYLGSSKNLDDAVMARYDYEQSCNYYECATTSSAYEYLKERGLLDGVNNEC
jgi:hypothetical protein